MRTQTRPFHCYSITNTGNSFFGALDFLRQVMVPPTGNPARGPSCQVFEITGVIPTSGQTHSVQRISILRSVLVCRSHNPDQNNCAGGRGVLVIPRLAQMLDAGNDCQCHHTFLVCQTSIDFEMPCF